MIEDAVTLTGGNGKRDGAPNVSEAISHAQLVDGTINCR